MVLFVAAVPSMVRETYYFLATNPTLNWRGRRRKLHMWAGLGAQSVDFIFIFGQVEKTEGCLVPMHI